MESELGNEEEAQFNKLAENREQNFMYNHTAGGAFTPDESLMLNSNKFANGERRITGAMKGLKLQTGDVVDMEVWVKHGSTCGASEITASTFLFAALTSGFGLVAAGETMQAYTAFNTLLGSAAFIDQTPCDVPRAYLNYIFFDENYANPQTNFKQINSTANGNFQQLTSSFTASSSGYLYIYLSNESNLNVDIFFDDLKITHSSNLSIVSADDYYPFGLTFNEYQNQEEQKNNFKFQGQEHIDDLDLNWISFKWRNHDPAIGRFFNVDPLAEAFYYNSPYAFSENKVTTHIELEGLEAIRHDYALKADEMAVLNGEPGAKKQFRDNANARAVGAVIGLLINNAIWGGALGPVEFVPAMLPDNNNIPDVPDPTPEEPQPDDMSD